MLTGLTHAYELVESADPHRLAHVLHVLCASNPEARRHIVAMLTPLPVITPEAIEADPLLTESEKAQAYDMLFEYHGEDDEGWPL